MNRLMVDLCSGLGGASQPFLDAGWEVVRVDNNPDFNPDVCVDIRSWSWEGERPTLIWASPPCTEFAKWALPWFRNPAVPDMSIFLACRQIIAAASPHYWVIENVRGAVQWLEPYLGRPRVYGSFYLWGEMPPMGDLPAFRKHTDAIRSPARRSLVPYELAERLRYMVEHQPRLWGSHVHEHGTR